MRFNILRIKCPPSKWSIFIVTSFTISYQLSCVLGFIPCSNSVNEFQSHSGIVEGCFHENITAQSLLKGRKISGTILTEFHSHPEIAPSWLNLTLVEVGQHFAQKNLGHVLMAHLLALVYDNFLPEFKSVLLASGSTSLKNNAAIRYTATSTQVILWYRNNIGIPFERKILLKSLENVRKYHLDAGFKIQHNLQDKKFLEQKRQQVFSYMRSQPHSIFHNVQFWTAVRKDLEESSIPPRSRRDTNEWSYNGIPINQLGQSLTQFSFVGLFVLFHKQLGIIQVSEEELRGFIHLWAFLGHVLGIQEEYNICIEDNLQKSEKLFQDILDTYYLPALFQMDENSHIELSALLDGLNIISPNLTPRLIMFRFLRDMVGIQPRNLLKTLNIVERMNLAGMDALFGNNLYFNRLVINQGGVFDIDVSVYKYFGKRNSIDYYKSRNAFFRV